MVFESSHRDISVLLPTAAAAAEAPYDRSTPTYIRQIDASSLLCVCTLPPRRRREIWPTRDGVHAITMILSHACEQKNILVLLIY